MRTIAPSGAYEVRINGEYYGSNQGADYEMFLPLVGTSETYTFNPAAPSPRSSNYGCGHNDKIHTYLSSHSETLYRTDVEEYENDVDLLLALISTLGAPAFVLSVIANYLHGEYIQNFPYMVTITLRTYRVTYVSGVYAFHCYHTLIGEYSGPGILTDSHEVFAQEVLE